LFASVGARTVAYRLVNRYRYFSDHNLGPL